MPALFARDLAPLRGVREPAPEPPDDEAVRRARGRAFHVIIRTCFYDDFLQAAAAAGIRQVVLIGAGLDARAFRLGWPSGMTIFEVDLPGVLAAKQRVLDSLSAVPRCRRCCRRLCRPVSAVPCARTPDGGRRPGRPGARTSSGRRIRSGLLRWHGSPKGSWSTWNPPPSTGCSVRSPPCHPRGHGSRRSRVRDAPVRLT